MEDMGGKFFVLANTTTVLWAEETGEKRAGGGEKTESDVLTAKLKLIETTRKKKAEDTRKVYGGVMNGGVKKTHRIPWEKKSAGGREITSGRGTKEGREGVGRYRLPLFGAVSVTKIQFASSRVRHKNLESRRRVGFGGIKKA